MSRLPNPSELVPTGLGTSGGRYRPPGARRWFGIVGVAAMLVAGGWAMNHLTLKHVRLDDPSLNSFPITLPAEPVEKPRASDRRPKAPAKRATSTGVKLSDPAATSRQVAGMITAPTPSSATAKEQAAPLMPAAAPAVPKPVPAEPQIPSRTAPQVDVRAVKSSYAARLWQHIAMRRPRGLNLQGSALVRFVVDTSGHASGISIARSSGNRLLDQLAERTVKRASPMPLPPAELGAGPFQFSIEFSFD